MGQVTIKPLDNGPYVVEGEVVLLDGEGKTIKVANELHLCRCGLTKNSPYCDGSHIDKYKSEVRAE